MLEAKIIPQRKARGRKWVQCEPHQAQRFCLCKGIRILQIYPTREAAKKNLASNSHKPIKPMIAGERYKTDWRGTYAKSLTQDQYRNSKGISK
jgi:hypothetical protein